MRNNSCGALHLEMIVMMPFIHNCQGALHPGEGAEHRNICRE